MVKAFSEAEMMAEQFMKRIIEIIQTPKASYYPQQLQHPVFKDAFERVIWYDFCRGFEPTAMGQPESYQAALQIMTSRS